MDRSINIHNSLQSILDNLVTVVGDSNNLDDAVASKLAIIIKQLSEVVSGTQSDDPKQCSTNSLSDSIKTDNLCPNTRLSVSQIQYTKFETLTALENSNSIYTIYKSRNGLPHKYFKEYFPKYPQFDESGAEPKPLSFHEQSMPELHLQTASPFMSEKSSRPCARLTKVLSDKTEIHVSKIAEKTPAASIFITLSSAEFLSLDVTSVKNSQKEMLCGVASRIFSEYSFMESFQFDLDVFGEFIDALSRYHVDHNPFRCCAHTADILLNIHKCLSQPNVGINFTDCEIFGLLLSALFVNLGNVGVSNQFLLQLNHPLSRIFSSVHTQESVAIMIGTQLLHQYNFMEIANKENPKLLLSLQETVTDLVIACAPKNYQDQLKEAQRIRGIVCIRDYDVPPLMCCVLRAAMLGFCVKEHTVHAKWAQKWIDELYIMNEAERLLGFSDGVPWTGEVATSIVGTFVNRIAAPYLTALEPLLPSCWIESLKLITSGYSTLTTEFSSSIKDGPSPYSENLVQESRQFFFSPTDDLLPWSDNSSLSLDLLGALIPACSMVYATQRLSDYYTFLQLYSDFMVSVTPIVSEEEQASIRREFGGSLVELAFKLDPRYIGEYASVIIDSNNWQTYSEAARLIMDTEVAPPSATSFASPSRRSRHTTDAFMVLLLRMFYDESKSHSNSSAPDYSDINCNYTDNLTSQHSKLSQDSYRRIRQIGPFSSRWKLNPTNNLYLSNNDRLQIRNGI